MAIKAYHGTAIKFDSFDGGKARVSNDYYGGGFAYFTSNKTVAVGYAKSAMIRLKSNTPYVIEVELNFKRLFDATDNQIDVSQLKDIVDSLGNKLESFARGAGLLNFGTSIPLVLSDLKAYKAKMTGAQFFAGLSRAYGSMENARKFLQLRDYDGLKHTGGQVTRDKMGTPDHIVYIVYDPAVIESFKRFKVPKELIDKLYK